MGLEPLWEVKTEAWSTSVVPCDSQKNGKGEGKKKAKKQASYRIELMGAGHSPTVICTGGMLRLVLCMF